MVEDRIAERAREGLEDGCPRQEPELVVRQARKELGAEVLGHKKVVTMKRGHALYPGAARLRREYRQVETCSPALGVLRQLGDLVVRQIHPGRPQQFPRAGLVNAQLVRPDLHRQAVCAHRSQRQRGMVP